MKLRTHIITPVVPDEGVLGPAMRALPTDRMRAFVVAMHENALRGENARYVAYRDAGYGGPNQTQKSITTSANQLAHDERVQRAFVEEGLRRLGSMVPIAAGTIAEIIMSPKSTATERMRAAGMILNRVGMPETTEHKVTTKREFSDAEKLESALRIARVLGMDPRVLLGNYGIPLPARLEAPAEIVIEAEDIEEVIDARDW
jgi:hypothetical protein